MIDFTDSKPVKPAFVKYKLYKRLGQFGMGRGLAGESFLREPTARVWKRNQAKNHVKQLRTLGITHVINLRRSHNRQIQKFKHLWLPFKDNAKPRPRWFYKPTLKFYRKAMKRTDAKLFVMCHHGICRSASLTYFFLRSSGKSPNKAEAKVRRARPTHFASLGATVNRAKNSCTLHE